jgi:ankyrin repeat protein
MCGSTEIDGHAYCLGLEALKTTFEDSMTQVNFLIRGAIFRSKCGRRNSERLRLNTCCLAELFDRYHANKATIRHDKVYALLGMSSDDLSAAGLEINYSTRWSVLMQSLVKFFLNSQGTVETWDDREMALIRDKGYIIGKVSLKKGKLQFDGRQNLEAVFTTVPNSSVWTTKKYLWTLPTSAKSIQDEDLICLIQGSSKPMIIRLHKDHFAIVVIAAQPPEYIPTEIGDIKWTDYVKLAQSPRNLLLVWDWDSPSEISTASANCKTLMPKSNQWSEYSTTDIPIDDRLDRATRYWNVALILEDLGHFEGARTRFRTALEGYEEALGEDSNGALVDSLLTKGDADARTDMFNQTPLSWAAGYGFEAFFKRLFATGRFDVDLKDGNGRTPLSWAAGYGHWMTKKPFCDIDVDAEDTSGRPQPWQRAEYEVIVRLLLATGNVDLNSKDVHDRTPLSYAAHNGSEVIVKLLLGTNRVEIDTKDKLGRTPMCWAAEYGHKEIVELLLATGQVDVCSEVYGRTLLSWGRKMSWERDIVTLIERAVTLNGKA